MTTNSSITSRAHAHAHTRTQADARTQTQVHIHTWKCPSYRGAHMRALTHAYKEAHTHTSQLHMPYLDTRKDHEQLHGKVGQLKHHAAALCTPLQGRTQNKRPVRNVSGKTVSSCAAGQRNGSSIPTGVAQTLGGMEH